MNEAAGVRCVRLAGDDLIEYVAWKINVPLILKRLHAIGGIGAGTIYLLDLLDSNRDIVDDVPLTTAGVRYLRRKKMLQRADTGDETDG